MARFPSWFGHIASIDAPDVSGAAGNMDVIGETSDFVMSYSSLVVGVIAVALVINIYLIVRPSTDSVVGRMLGFVGVFLLPIIVIAYGTGEHLDKSKRTEFCLSCHVMQGYGKSLHVDDNEFVPASHFQNNRIPRDQACFTCHTEYTLYGDFAAKIRGLRHVFVQYLGTIPDTVRLYERFSNRECLHCHAGSRSFEDAGVHRPDAATKDSIMTDKKSCVSSGCHDVVHNVHELKDYELWDPNNVKSKEATDGSEN